MFLLLAPLITRARIAPHNIQSVMERFVLHYNAQSKDSLCALVPTWTDTCFWLTEKFEFGRINDYDYIGQDTVDKRQVHVYFIHWSKHRPATFSFTLRTDGPFGTFRMVTTSPEIRRILKKWKQRKHTLQRFPYGSGVAF